MTAPPTLFTLAQLARRSGISPGYARMLKQSTRLPSPDARDADGGPLWLAETIDHWSTTPVAPRDAQPGADGIGWLFTVPEATEQAPISYWGIVTHPTNSARRVHVVRYDTPHGPLLWVRALDDEAAGWEGLDDRAAAQIAAQKVSAALWSDALIAVHNSLLSTSEHEPTIRLFRLEAETAPHHGEPGEEHRTGFLRVLTDMLRSSGPRHELPATAAVRPRARVSASVLAPADLARLTGTNFPIWPEGTCLATRVPATAHHSETLALTEPTPTWNTSVQRLRTALHHDLATTHPAAFALLIADTRDDLEAEQATYESQATRGEGWYLAVRPAPPRLPLDVDAQLPADAPRVDADAVRTDLADLLEIEPKTGLDQPMGEVYAHTISLLTRALKAADPHDPLLSRRPYLVEDSYATDSGAEATRAWIDSLDKVDTTALEHIRRGRRLRGDHAEPPVWVGQDRDGTLTAFYTQPGGQRYVTEWPASLDVVAEWGEDTLIVADPDPLHFSGLVFARHRSGRLDRIPHPSRHCTFRYGYASGGPSDLYRALVRAALECPGSGLSFEAPDTSELWKAVSTPQDGLRLPWPQVRAWAEQDQGSTENRP
ncbi:hypothetical protein [Nocardiopsis synnemataformans]|uniref:hypothetical protein n=1 Tax=Nocardiopsis synnemataformans TaxID=61305 RepID=UPI003EC0FE91